MVSRSARRSTWCVFFSPQRPRFRTSERYESAVETPEARNVGPMRAQLRAQIGTEVALNSVPVFDPINRATGRARMPRRRAGTSLVRTLESELPPSSPSSAA
jgi:hypothetical protein